MRDHGALLQAAVDGHGGRVVKEIGDAFMAEFAVVVLQNSILVV